MESSPSDIETIGSAFTDTPEGPFYRVVQMERRVKIYPITESELSNINLFSGIVTAMASIGSGTAAFLASVWWDILNAAEGTAPHKNGTAVTIFCFLVLVACWVVGHRASSSKGTSLQKILSESRER